MPELKKGILIAVEGIDGSGKSTLAKGLFKILSDNHYNTILTKEPGGSKLGKKLRTILQTQTIPVSPRSEYLLFAADRAQHFEELIIPQLQNNTLIISDRMSDSSLAYQGYGRGLDNKMINTVNHWAMHAIKPNVTLYTKVPITVALERIKQRKALTAFEQRKSFLQRVTNGFETLYQNRADVMVIDGTQAPNNMITNAYEAIIQWIHNNNLIT